MRIAMFTLPNLPYTQAALEPHISAETMKTHHRKHHKKYVDTLNELVEGTAHQDATLDEILMATRSAREGKDRKIFNNAAQHWNHSFLWNSFTPDYDREAAGSVIGAIKKDFGSFAKFRTAFVEEGVGHFGSGWVWLVATKSALEIMSTHDADLPLAHGKQALLTCDLWEHAYYLDYKSDRAGFLETFIDKLANWEFARSNLAGLTTSRVSVAAE
jgi:Fe-Mn family superoxide dismutase